MATTPPSGREGLRSSLGNRQMTMIAIGGVIGAGLFVGSGKAIGVAGPGVLLAYVGVGAIVVFVMRMLAEMAVARPETGSFSSYAGRELGPWAGLSVGWLYAYQWSVTIAAGEAVDPVHAVRRGMNSVVWRILIFYIGSIFVVVALLPWNSTEVTQSPYTAVLRHLGIPGAALVMNVVVLTAVLSCLNSGIYSSSRMLYALARRGEAPAPFGRTSRAGVPWWAVFAASSVGLLTVVANYFIPTEAVFEFLLGMAFDAGSRRSLLLTLLVTVLTVVAGLVRQRRSHSSHSSHGSHSTHSTPAPPETAQLHTVTKESA